MLEKHEEQPWILVLESLEAASTACQHQSTHAPLKNSLITYENIYNNCHHLSFRWTFMDPLGSYTDEGLITDVIQ